MKRSTPAARPPRDIGITICAVSVRACIAERKIQARRTINRLRKFGKITEFGPSTTPGVDWHFRDRKGIWNDITTAQLLDLCPYGRAGDHHWAREATFDVEKFGWEGPLFVESEQGQLATEWGYGEDDDPDHIQPDDLRTRAAMFMMKKYARFRYLVASVRPELLQAITPEDAVYEGVGVFDLGDDGIDYSALSPKEAWPWGWHHNDPVAAYREYWESINGEGSWNTPTWVWAIEWAAL
jgi:hypothetical protein